MLAIPPKFLHHAGMAKTTELKGIGTSAMMGTATLLKTAALLGPLQVCGAAMGQEASFTAPAAATSEAYNWDSQKSVTAGTDRSMKEGTATGSSGDNHLEDWND